MHASCHLWSLGLRPSNPIPHSHRRKGLQLGITKQGPRGQRCPAIAAAASAAAAAWHASAGTGLPGSLRHTTACGIVSTHSQALLACHPTAHAGGDENAEAPLEPEKKYRVAVKEYLATGKDGFDVFEASAHAHASALLAEVGARHTPSRAGARAGWRGAVTRRRAYGCSRHQGVGETGAGHGGQRAAVTCRP